MRKAIMTNQPIRDDEKVMASDYSIVVNHKSGRIVELSTLNYTFEDVFDYIKEQYEEDLDQIQKVTIEVVR